MHENHQPISAVPVTSSSSPLEALRARIEREAPHLRVLGEHHDLPRPFLLVKDTAHRILVGFTCEEEYTLYRQVVECLIVLGGAPHA